MKVKNKQLNNNLFIILLLCVLLLGTVGATFAWLRNLQQLNTVSLVQIPSKITLSGANRSELQRISLELTNDDTKDENGVIIRRVFCVESTHDYLLEVIRTTNIEDMEIKIYPVKSKESNKVSDDNKTGNVKGNDGVKTYYYCPEDTELDSVYLNETEDKIAIQNGFEGTLHGENYIVGDSVQKNAEPLYWRTKDVVACNLDEYGQIALAADGITEIYYRYYVLELRWNTDSQETDLVYLLASHSDK